MVTVKKSPQEKLYKLIPIYFEYVSEYLRSGKRLPSELNPIYLLSDDIDSMTEEDQENLLKVVDYNIEVLKSLVGELSFFN